VSGPHTLGKYELIAELGHGGMADVFLAMIGGPTGSGFTKLAVIKRLRPNLVEDPEFVAMLVDEARISARLNHPNVIQTIEVGVEGEEYYLAMEFLEGQPLHRIQRRAARTGIPLPRDLEYLVIADALAGLHHAHELADYDGTPLGIVHRDVTPQNVFVTYDGSVKVVDFGIAKAAGRASETKQGIVKGKVRYMSPEQALGGTVDRRTDIFAAGILLWGAATGRRFWGDTDDLGIVQALVAGKFDPSPRALDPKVPAEIDAMCRKALACNPDDRYATAADFLADLEAFLADHIVSARRRLGAYLTSNFGKERAELRSVVERASRRERAQPSVAVLMASTQSAVAAAVASSSPPSLAPVDIASRPSSRPAPPAPRFGTGAIAAAAAMFAASIVLLTQVADRAGTASAASSVGQRETAHAIEARTEVVLRSTAHKRVADLRVTPAPHIVFVAAPAPRAAAAPPPAAPPPAAPVTASRAPAAPEVHPDGRRRARPAIDTADPWGTPSEN
jgi:eukaryotic-like serine/threonine-protein kinase